MIYRQNIIFCNDIFKLYFIYHVPGKVDEKATQLHAIASLKVLLDATKPHNGAASTSAANHVEKSLETQLAAQSEPNGIALTAQIEPLVSNVKAIIS